MADQVGALRDQAASMRAGVAAVSMLLSRPSSAWCSGGAE
jgi:hypothetical protein